MPWIPIAIFAHFFWALVNIGDKYIVSNKVKNPYVYMVWLALLGILAIVLIPFVDFVIPETKIFLWLIFAGALYFYGGIPYIKAVMIEEISRINIWWQLIPIFSFGIAWFALNEKLNLNQMVAMIILVVGGGLTSLHIKKKTISFSRAFKLMVIACLAFAGYAVIIHYISNIIPFISVFIWSSIIVAIFSLTLFISKKFRVNFKDETRKLNDKKLLSIIFGIAIFDGFGLIFNIWALSLGPVALVFAMEGWQVLFVFAIALGISIFKPHILKEELDKKNLILKFTALILMVIGILLINLG